MKTKHTPTYEYLNDLAERIREIPVMYGVDGGDIDELPSIAENYDTIVEALKAAEEFIGEVSGEINMGNIALPELLQNKICSYQNQIQAALWKVENE